MESILKKTHPKSYMKLFHMRSNFAEKVFSEGSNVIVLQIVECSDKELLAELVNWNDYDEGKDIVRL